MEQRLVRFRDKTVRDFKDQVIALHSRVENIDVSLPSFTTGEYDNDLADAAIKLQNLNDYISDVRDKLERKIANPFTVMDGFDQDNVDQLVAKCRAALSQVYDDVVAYNQIFEERDSLKHEFDRKSIQLAYHENKTWIDRYNDRIARAEELNSDSEGIEREIEKQVSTIKSLKSRIDQVDDARIQINEYLGIIFGPNRMQLVPAGKDKYKLQVKQGDSFLDIPPNAISSGERNALALAYFFACVLEKKDKYYNYCDPTLLVIDDPVSSFDTENKAGVVSLISMQCKKILSGNSESKALVLTHDYTTLKALCDERERRITPNETDSFFSLSPNHVLRSKKCSQIRENMEYSSLLWDNYNFAKMDEPDNYDGDRQHWKYNPEICRKLCYAHVQMSVGRPVLK